MAVGPSGEAQGLLDGLVAKLGLSGPLLPGHDAHGRPTLCIDGRPVAFSRSRAANQCALALKRQGRVGVDLVAAMTGDPELLEAHFHRSERAWLQGLRGEARSLTTTRCWAAKEAVLKALGLGLAFGLGTVELVPEGDRNLRVARITGQRAEGWNLEVSSHEGLIVALAWAH